MLVFLLDVKALLVYRTIQN